MKKGNRYLLLTIFILVHTLYLPDTAVAMEPVPESVSESSLDEEPAAESVSESSPDEGPAAELMSESSSDEEEAAELMSESSPNEEPDGISSAAELTDWLESHKCSGGRAALTADITMDESYMFMSYSNMPPLFVETGEYTIFVCADTEFWSDGRLTFVGEGGEQGIFHVKQGGTLLLDGVTVEMTADGGGSQYALWQEEGAGMLLGDTFSPCRVSGNVHYAETPLVTETEPVCVVVEKGELLDGRLPTEVACVVNYQGAKMEREPVAVSWDMTGTDKQRAERLRFQLQGIFPQAAAGTKAVCTVVYHDFPLTFTRAEAVVRSNACIFRGDYLKQEGALSAVISPEYSLDGENWIREGENNILNANNGFYISFPCDQWDVSVYPYLYIRLRGDTKERIYYSNVLRYAANNMDIAEDLGGSRGGGTAIVDPPGEPEKPAESGKPGKQEKADEPIAVNGAAKSDKMEQSWKASEFCAQDRKHLSAVTLEQQDRRNGDENEHGQSQPAENIETEATVGNGMPDLAVQDTPADTDRVEAVEPQPQPGLSAKNDGGSMAAGSVPNYGLMVGAVVLSAAFGAACFFASKGTNR